MLVTRIMPLRSTLDTGASNTPHERGPPDLANPFAAMPDVPADPGLVQSGRGLPGMALPDVDACGGDALSEHATRILLVDDEEAVRQVVQDFFGEIRLPVAVAADAIEAIAVLERSPHIDLLLTDIRMPGLSGIELADAAMQLRPNLRVVLMSGYFLPQPVARRFIRKPFRLAELEAVIRQELRL